MSDILNMHIIKERLNVEKIRQKNANMVGIYFKYWNSNSKLMSMLPDRPGAHRE